VLTKEAKVPWNTIPRALSQIDDLLTTASPGKEMAFLNDVRRFLVDMADRYGAA
jgi:hypothetical protein